VIHSTQTVTASAPRKRAEPVELPAVVVTQNAPVARTVSPASCSVDAMCDWALDQPAPAKLGMREFGAQFPGSTNAQRAEAIRTIREVCKV
jgi:hypothetical protein